MGSRAAEVCRLCACRLEEGKGEWIFVKEGETRGRRGMLPLSDNIRRYIRLEIQEEDDLPQRVCPRCCSTLDNFHKFAEDCLRAQDKILVRIHSMQQGDSGEEEDSETLDDEHPSDGMEEIDDFCVRNLELEWGDSPPENQSFPESSDPGNKKASESKEMGARRKSRKQRKPARALLSEEESSEEGNPTKVKVNKAEEGSKEKDAFKVACMTCGEEHEKWSTLTQHYREVHTALIVQGKCICGETIKKTEQMTYHRQKHLMMFRCSKCGRSFCNKVTLEKHRCNRMPKKNKEIFQCSQCKKSFLSEALLKRHQKIHVPVEERAIWQCDICNKNLCSKSSLLTHHRMVHTGDKSHACEVCGRTFTFKSNLKEHMLTHGDSNSFICEKCGKGFKCKTGLRIHLEVHNEDPLVCNVCGMHLKTSRTLERHMVIHSDETPYLCKYCGKGFKRYKTLKGHYEFHEGKKTYHCKFCGRNFNNASNCRTHQRRMHVEELYKEGRPPLAKKVKVKVAEDAKNGLPGISTDNSGSNFHSTKPGCIGSCKEGEMAGGKQGIMQVISDHASWHQNTYSSAFETFATARASLEQSFHHSYMHL